MDPIVGDARCDGLHRVGTGKSRRKAHRAPRTVARQTDGDFAGSLRGVRGGVGVRVVARHVFGRVADVLPRRHGERKTTACEQVVEEVVTRRDARLDDGGLFHRQLLGVRREDFGNDNVRDCGGYVRHSTLPQGLMEIGPPHGVRG